MIPKIQKILYPTDLSLNSDYAFRYAINSAKQHDANIIILYVLEGLSDSMLAMLSSDLVGVQRKKTSEEAMAQIKDRLKLFCEKELINDPDCLKRVESIEVLEGYPAEVILREAEKLNCDVIVMGSHGKGIISQTFLGSVTKRVLRRTRKPVFIIPLPKKETDIPGHNI
ncbi:MAG: universal stress protein [Deltaproteobacteria bacterium]|nr:MAG: universal stress protein [Deltaproteobacteria bacterium]